MNFSHNRKENLQEEFSNCNNEFTDQHLFSYSANNFYSNEEGYDSDPNKRTYYHYDQLDDQEHSCNNNFDRKLTLSKTGIKVPIYGKKNSGIKEFNLINSDFKTEQLFPIKNIKNVINNTGDNFYRNKLENEEFHLNHNKSNNINSKRREKSFHSKSVEKSKDFFIDTITRQDLGKIDLSLVHFITLKKFSQHKFYSIKNNDINNYEYTRIIKGSYHPPLVNKNKISLISIDMRRKINVTQFDMAELDKYKNNRKSIWDKKLIKNIIENDNLNFEDEIKHDNDLSNLIKTQINDDVDSFFDDKLYDEYNLDLNDKNIEIYQNKNNINLQKFLTSINNNYTQNNENNEEDLDEQIINEKTNTLNNSINQTKNNYSKFKIKNEHKNDNKNKIENKSQNFFFKTFSNINLDKNKNSFYNHSGNKFNSKLDVIENCEKKIKKVHNNSIRFMNNIIYNHSNKTSQSNFHNKKSLLEKIKSKYRIEDFESFKDYNEYFNSIEDDNLNEIINENVIVNNSNINKFMKKSFQNEINHNDKISTYSTGNDSKLNKSLKSTTNYNQNFSNFNLSDEKVKLFFNLDEFKELKDHSRGNSPDYKSTLNKFNKINEFKKTHKKIPLMKNSEKRFFVPNSRIHCSIYPINKIHEDSNDNLYNKRFKN